MIGCALNLSYKKENKSDCERSLAMDNIYIDIDIKIRKNTFVKNKCLHIFSEIIFFYRFLSLFFISVLILINKILFCYQRFHQNGK